MTPRRRTTSWLSAVLVALAVTIAAASLLGPVGVGVMRYRTSPTTLNQLVGSDAAALVVVAPLTLVVAGLAARRHPVEPLLALGIGVYCLYTYAQVVVGQEYLRLPGNVERFFPLLLAIVVLAEAVVVLAWRAVPPLPPVPRPLERTAGATLLVVAVFLLVGLHLRTLLLAWTDPGALVEYASSPTPFWLVKLMDLGVVIPAATVTGIGLLRDAGWARRAAYVLFTGFTCLAVSVAAMGVVMLANADPDASVVVTAGFVVFALVFAALTAALYRPLLRARPALVGSAP